MIGIILAIGLPLTAGGNNAADNPLGFPAYRQEIVATFADAASAAKAEMSVAALPDGASRAFATRWDDSTPKHVAKAAMLERVGVKGNFYLVGGEDAPVPAWARDLIAHGHAIGNHTLDHRHMNELSADEAYRQILLERIRLETALGVTVNSYVSPYGWGAASWTPERKRGVLESVVETGHWVSCDNPNRAFGVPGTVWMAANRFSANDKSPDRAQFETGLASQVAAADRDPLFPRIVLGTHSWCDEAGNALQEELIRAHCIRPDWVQLNDWEYGAYRYSALNARPEKRDAKGVEARFSVVRFEPVSLASAIPLSIAFSSAPEAVSCGGRPLVRGKNGTWVLPHGPDRAARPAAIVRDAWRNVALKLVPCPDRKTVRVVLENGSGERLRNVAVAVMAPPGCDRRRLTFDAPEVEKDARLERESAAGGRERLFAANADFDVAAGRVRIWATCSYSDGPDRKPGQIDYKVEMNHADAMYRVGEKAVLTVWAVNGTNAVNAGTVKVTMDNFGPKSLGSRTVDLAKENPFKVEMTLDEPGFARMQVTGDGRPKPFVWGVGYEPEKIVAGGEDPADFDAFWRKGVETLAATVPLDPKVTPVPAKSTAEFDYYRISFATLGDRRVHGFLTVPKGRPGAKYPVSVEVSSAGVGNWILGTRGFPDRIHMYFVVYDFAPPETLDELKVLSDDMSRRLMKRYGIGSYSSAGLAKSPEDYFLYPVVLGINRAIDWLWERPDVDRARFGYEGGSQGGCFGWMLCGLNRKFTSAVLRVPAMSDVRANLAGREGSWPKAVENARRAGQDFDAVVRNIAYFDGASFAPRIRIPIRVTVGLSDTTCPPNAVHATFNRLGSKDKEILNAIGKGHGGQTREYDEIARRWQYGL